MKQNGLVFNRYEKKYLINELQYNMLLKRIGQQFETDKFGLSRVCNIYFDTPGFQLIRRSLEKPLYKEKLRLRSYEIPNENSRTFLELKKKYKGVVYKRRAVLPYKQAEAYLYRGIAPVDKSQIIREIDWFINYYHDLEPAMFIGYQREAVRAIENKDLRITFDSDIIWRNEYLKLTGGFCGNSLLEPGQIIMEIKVLGSMPVWLAKELSDLRIYPVSYSKYGNAYKALLKQKKIVTIKGDVYCCG